VHSSHGTFEVDEVGIPTDAIFDTCERYSNVLRVDLEEYGRWAGKHETSLDILLVGFWAVDPDDERQTIVYEPADEDARKLARENQALILEAT
jgi:hypothetical protein